MNELQEILKEEYEKQATITAAMLMEMVEEALGSFSSLVEGGEKQERPEEGFYLPPIRITEAWGRPGTKDRQIIEQFTKTIVGNTLEEKLTSLNNIVSKVNPGAGIPEILGTMVVIEILNALLADFTESAGGFIFEGFLAGLFGGEAEQITDVGDETGEATGKPITDVVIGGREYSLKLLGQTTAVKGSFKNMVEHFKGRDHVVYLDARRTGEGLEFGEFEITLDNFLDVFYEPFKKIARDQLVDGSEGLQGSEALSQVINKVGEKDVTFVKFQKSPPGTNKRKFSKEALAELSPEQIDSTVVAGVYYNKAKEFDKQSAKIKKLFGDGAAFDSMRAQLFRYKKQPSAATKAELLAFMTTLAGYKNKEQFDFTRGQAESIHNFKSIGELKIGPEVLKETWIQYGEVLKENVEPIYRALGDFTTNINLFFLSGEKEVDHKGHGMEAAQDARDLQTSTDKAVKDMSASPAPAIGPQTHRPFPGTPGE